MRNDSSHSNPVSGGTARRFSNQSSGSGPRQTVAHHLRRKVTSGDWKVGAQIPTSKDLAEHYSVSPAVIREALAALAREGLIVTQPGRGNFVTASVRGSHFVPSGVIRWSDLVASSGAGSVIKLIPPEQVAAPKPDMLTRERLGDATLSRQYIRLYRSSVYRDKPLALSDTYVDEGLYRRHRNDFDTYATMVAMDRLAGVTVKDGFQFFKVIEADVEIAWHLDIISGDSVGESNMWLIDDNNTVIYQARHIFSTDFINFRFDLDLEN